MFWILLYKKNCLFFILVKLYNRCIDKLKKLNTFYNHLQVDLDVDSSNLNLDLGQKVANLNFVRIKNR